MKNFRLIISSINETEEIFDKNVNEYEKIYLGNWCFKDRYLATEQKVVNYHWNDRQKLEKDFFYLDKLHEKLLISLQDTLNKFHKKKNSLKFWRILCGYWLHCYISSTFDRWENIQKAFKEYPNINQLQIYYDESLIVGSNTREFMNLVSDEKWNQNIYHQILSYLEDKANKKFSLEKKIIKVNTSYYKNYRINFKAKIIRYIFKVYNHFLSYFLKKNKIILYKTYLGKFDEFLINLKFFQFPNYFSHYESKSQVDQSLRENLNIDFNAENSFEIFLKKNLFLHIPKEFLEDFDSINDFIKSSNFPPKPKKIFTTRTLSNDSVFVRYMAEKKETENIEIIIGQHGGVYGHFKFLWAEDHEVKISDKFLTWGWKKKNYKNVLPFGYIKSLKYRNEKIPKKMNTCSYFLRSRGKYPHRLDSSTGSNQMSKYYQNSLNFFKILLSEKKSSQVTPRFHEAEFGWGHLSIWKNKFPNLDYKYSFDESMNEVLEKYDLLIFSYIATGFLECLAMNKPFIIISSLSECPLRDEVLEDFKKLKSAKIFFEKNEDAIEHLDFLKNNLSFWWNNDLVKKTRFDFSKKYVNRLSHKEKIEKIFKSHVN